jgi:hypothetical protein
MADAQTTTIHIGEVLILAGRLLARASSMLDTDRPEQQQDLRLAARVIRASVRSFNSGDAVTDDSGIEKQIPIAKCG